MSILGIEKAADITSLLRLLNPVTATKFTGRFMQRNPGKALQIAALGTAATTAASLAATPTLIRGLAQSVLTNALDKPWPWLALPIAGASYAPAAKLTGELLNTKKEKLSKKKDYHRMALRGLLGGAAAGGLGYTFRKPISEALGTGIRKLVQTIVELKG